MKKKSLIKENYFFLLVHANVAVTNHYYLLVIKLLVITYLKNSLKLLEEECINMKHGMYKFILTLFRKIQYSEFTSVNPVIKKKLLLFLTASS